MPETRSPAAQALIDDIASRSGLDAETTGIAVTLVSAFLAGSLTEHRLADLRRRIAEFDELAAEGAVRERTVEADRSSGGSFAGRFMSSFGDLVGGSEGGPVARTMTLVGHLGRVGLDVGEMRALGSGMIAHVRARLGDAHVDALVAKARARIPILGRFLA
ncbi:MAG: hypothetical protein OEL76_14130 [Siculibacillus sp.]|nr:hypothetical protein [Siculibacillus sp.]